LHLFALNRFRFITLRVLLAVLLRELQGF
jgi:hypothetical protein